MIFTLLFVLINSFLFSLLGFLPSAGSLPVGLSTSVTYIFGFLHILSFVIDLGTLYIVLALALTVEGIVVLWHFAHWLLRKLPFLHIS